MIYAAIYAVIAFFILILMFFVGAMGLHTIASIVFMFTMSAGFAMAACIAALIHVWRESQDAS